MAAIEGYTWSCLPIPKRHVPGLLGASRMQTTRKGSAVDPNRSASMHRLAIDTWLERAVRVRRVGQRQRRRRFATRPFDGSVRDFANIRPRQNDADNRGRILLVQCAGRERLGDAGRLSDWYGYRLRAHPLARTDQQGPGGDIRRVASLR